MNISYTYHVTHTSETLEPHIYVHRYQSEDAKAVLHSYKFHPSIYTQSYIESRDVCIPYIIDICIDRYISSLKNDIQPNRHSKKQAFIYTSPPSTMFERGEKDIDSMLHLLCTSVRNMFQYAIVPKHIRIISHKIFNIQQKHIQEKQAQHLGNNSARKNRVKNLEGRYYVSTWHTIYIWYCIHILQIQSFSYTIIDDVSSTGATLVACKQTLIRYLAELQKKNPHIRYDVWIVSLYH